VSKVFKKATFRELRIQPLGTSYALAVKVDIFGEGQEIVCFINSEGVLRQMEQAIPNLREEIKRLRKDGAVVI